MPRAYSKAFELVDQVVLTEKRLQGVAPSTPTHDLAREVGLIRFGTPEALDEYLASAPKDYLGNDVVRHVRCQMVARLDRADLLPVLEKHRVFMEVEHLLLVPFGPSRLRSDGLANLEGGGLGWRPSLSRVTLAQAWGDTPAALRLAALPVCPEEEPSSPAQARLWGASIALLQAAWSVEMGMGEGTQFATAIADALEAWQESAAAGADPAQPCLPAVQLLEFLDDDIREFNPLGQRVRSPVSVPTPRGAESDLATFLSPLVLAQASLERLIRRRTERFGGKPVTDEVVRSVVACLATTPAGREALAELFVVLKGSQAFEDLAFITEGVHLPFAPAGDWDPIERLLCGSVVYSQAATFQAWGALQEQSREPTLERRAFERWTERVVKVVRATLTGLPRLTVERLAFLETALLPWMEESQKTEWSVLIQALRDAVTALPVSPSEEEKRAFLMAVETAPVLAHVQAASGAASRPRPRL